MATKDRGRVLESVRQPEYTGENRCTPCTVVNVCIAAAVSGAIAVVSVPGALAAFVAFAATIYLRGYLVPGTPTLTKRYFPDRVLAWFDKEPMPEYAVPTDGDADDVDVEEALRAAGALVESDNPGDLVLHPEFRDQWYDELDRFDDATTEQALARFLGVPRRTLRTENRAKSYAVKVDGETAGKWESREALRADLAADRVLAERAENWTDLPVEERSGLLRSLRVSLDECPRCGGDVRLSEQTVGSCCRSRQVYACTCRDCKVRLFEINASEVEGPER